MSQLLSLISVLLLCSSVLGASAARTPLLPSITFTAPQLRVAVLMPTVAVGDQQTLQVQVEQSAARQATLVLAVTYPNGNVARTVHEMRGSDAQLTWIVPPAVGSGMATFSLTVAGCGCDQQSTVPPPLKLDTAVTGIFSVANSP